MSLSFNFSNSNTVESQKRPAAYVIVHIWNSARFLQNIQFDLEMTRPGFVCVQCWFSETAKSLLVITTALVCLVPVTARPHNVPEHSNLFKNLFHIIEGLTDFG